LPITEYNNPYDSNCGGLGIVSSDMIWDKKKLNHRSTYILRVSFPHSTGLPLLQVLHDPPSHWVDEAVSVDGATTPGNVDDPYLAKLYLGGGI